MTSFLVRPCHAFSLTVPTSFVVLDKAVCYRKMHELNRGSRPIADMERDAEAFAARLEHECDLAETVR